MYSTYTIREKRSDVVTYTTNGPLSQVLMIGLVTTSSAIARDFSDIESLNLQLISLLSLNLSGKLEKSISGTNHTYRPTNTLHTISREEEIRRQCQCNKALRPLTTRLEGQENDRHNHRTKSR